MFASKNIVLPRDHYAHPVAPTEWWWHIGTLRAGERVFGFEVNATRNGTEPLQAYAFSQIMVTDVAAKKHYHRTTLQDFDPQWAESDPERAWYVRLPGDSWTSGAILMNGPKEDASLMTVYATFDDVESRQRVTINLTLRQDGPPMLIWGDGRSEEPEDPAGWTPIEQYNYYYSYTRLHARGTIAIGADVHEVEGVTWMDHEYGAFSSSEHWTLNDAQLDNGVTLSTYTTDENAYPKVGEPLDSVVTMLWPDGRSTYHKGCVTIPGEPTWTGKTGIVYCLTQELVVPDLDDTILTFRSALQDQEFLTDSDPIYEGVANVCGKFQGQAVTGTAWVEQAIRPPTATAPQPKDSDAAKPVAELAVAETV